MTSTHDPQATDSNLQRWHRFMEQQDHDLLREMLHDDAVFHSPVVHTPQRGRELVYAYLAAAGEVLGGDGFEYVREIDGGDRVMLEFTCDLDGIHVNGVDIIEWNADGQIVDFKVMVRPLKAIQAVHGRMAAMLEAMKPGAEAPPGSPSAG